MQRFCMRFGGSQALCSVYQSEHVAFKAAAYRAGQCDALWAALDALLSD